MKKARKQTTFREDVGKILIDLGKMVFGGIIIGGILRGSIPPNYTNSNMKDAIILFGSALLLVGLPLFIIGLVSPWSKKQSEKQA